MNENKRVEHMGSSNSSSTGEEEHLKQLFSSCDTNNDGRLNRNDLYEMCYKLKMSEHAEEIINMLGARVKDSISLEEFLSCRKKVLFLETQVREEFEKMCNCSENKHHFHNKSVYRGINTCDLDFKRDYVDKYCDVLGANSIPCPNHISDGIANDENNSCNKKIDSCLSNHNPINSSAEYDSDAQDVCAEPQNLHMLVRCEYPDLYWAIFPSSAPTSSHSISAVSKTEEEQTTLSTQGLKRPKEAVPPLQSVLPTDVPVVAVNQKTVVPPPSTTTISTELAQRLFECANLLHTKCTTRLRSEVHDLSHRLRGLQVRHESTYRDWQQAERERDQVRHELSNHIARYEDRLIELHSVIAELRRRLEHAGTNTIPEADEFEEVDEDDDANGSLLDQPGISRAHFKESMLGDFRVNTKSGALPPPVLNDDVDSRSRFDPHSDRSSEGGGTSVGAIDGDHHLDVYAFHSKPKRAARNLNMTSSATDLFKLSCVMGCDSYEQIHPAAERAPDKASNPVASPLDYDSQSALVPLPTDTTTTTTKVSPRTSITNEEHMIANYENALSRLRTELDRVVRERDRLAEMVRSTATDTLPPNTKQLVHTETTDRSSPSLRPCMGLGQRMVQSKLGGSMDSPSLAIGVSTEIPIRTGSVGSCPPHSVANWTDQCHESNAEAHVYDVPEPDWVSATINHYHYQSDLLTARTAAMSNQTTAVTKSTFPSTAKQRSTLESAVNEISSRSSGATGTHEQDFQFDDNGGTIEVETEFGLSGSLSPTALGTLLRGLAERVPYPRLSEALNCAQLTWQCVLSKLVRYRADCFVLQANLAEAKSHSDRLQCQLNQIESYWSAAMRAACLADASMEISDCLNQLYATELAIMLYRQTKKSFFTAQAFSTLSSSTSSSSFPCRGKSSHVTCPVSVSAAGLMSQPLQPSNHLQTNLCSSSPHHPYAVYAVPGYTGTDCDAQSGNGVLNSQPLTLNLRTLRLFRYQAELTAQALLDRYEQLDSIAPDRFYPTVSSSANGAASSSLTRGLSRAQNTAPISPGMLSIHSPLGPIVPSTQSLTGSSIYANSWYVSLGRLGRSMAPGPTEQVSIGSCIGPGFLLNQTKLSSLNLNRGTTKIAPHHHQNGINGSGGWQTPDSGAGSSSTHEVTHPPLFSHSVYPPGSIELSSYEAALDLMPPILTQIRSPRNGHEHSFCDSDSDSSDSSEGEPPTSAAVGTKAAPNSTGPVSAATPIPSTTGWSRTDERKLRILLHQIINSRRAVRSTIVEQLPHTFEEDGLSEGRQSIKRESFPCGGQCISTESLGKFPLNVLLESSILLQELCSVKEERADLKARVYLLEKELHANRLTLESRIAAENALRAHLDALRLSSQDTVRHSTRTEDSRDGRLGGSQGETLLKAQVKNLLQALESLRHSSELQQMQNEELVDDLKRANSALIAAFEKAKRKYLSRIKKLEDQINRGLIQNSKTTSSAVAHPTRVHTHQLHHVTPPYAGRECIRMPATAAPQTPPPRSDPISDGRGQGNLHRTREPNHGLPPTHGVRSVSGQGHAPSITRGQSVIPHGSEQSTIAHAQITGDCRSSPCHADRSAPILPVHRAA